MDEVKSIESKDEGKSYDVPDSRIGSAADARSLVNKLKDGEWERSRRRARINGNLNGNRPWPSLVGQGQADRANFNQREGEGFVAAAKTPYYDLVFEVDRYAKFTIDYEGEPSRISDWEEKVGTRYHYALDNWDGMDANFQRSQYQMVVHGVGPMAWEDARDWRSKSAMAGQFLVPDDASADIEEWETAAKPRSYLPSDLYDLIKDESAATAAKWNVDVVKQAIMSASEKIFQDTHGHKWEFYEAEIRRGAVAWNNKSKRIFVADIFQKEFSGKISHFIIRDKPSADDLEDESKEPEIGFLFRKVGRFKSFSEILQPFLYDVGPDGHWHSVKGAGPKILDFCSISDRLTCKMVDGANATTGLIVQANDGNALQKTAISHINGGVCVAPGYSVHQNRFADNLQSPLLVKRDLKSTLDRNFGRDRRRQSDQDPFPTLGQEQMNASEEATLTKSDVNRYCRSLDKWHRETFKRLLAMGERLYSKRKDVAPGDDENLSPSEQGALEFYRGCIRDGVPEEVLKFENFCRIKANRAIGNGSSQMRMMVADKFMQAAPMMNERGRNAAQRMWASVYGGQTAADMLFPRFDTPQLNDDHMALATLENNALRQLGGQVLVTPQQDDVVHFDTHIKDVAAHAQALQQGQSDPMQLLIHMEQAGPHMHEHLSKVAGDPTRKDQVKQMQKSWLEMSKMADQLKQHIEESQQSQQQPAPQPDPALIAGLAKVHSDHQIKQTKMEGDLELKKQKQDAMLHLKDLQTAHNLRLKAFQASTNGSRQTPITRRLAPKRYSALAA
jgi:hypothetical protein